MVWYLRSHGERLSKGELRTCKTTKRVDGLAWTTKIKALARGEASKTKARAKANLVRAKARARAKERVNNTARKGRKDVTECRGTKTNKKHENQPRIHKSGRARVGITLTTGLTQTGGRATGSQICGLILHGSKRQDSNPTHGGSISMLGGLTMCELSVDDGEQQK